MIRRIPQKLSQSVTSRLSRGRRPGHAVGLIHNDQVPMNLAKPRQDVLALCQVEGSKNLILFQPLIDPELIADVAALHNEEFFVELFFKLPLPLKREIRRTDDQDPLGESSQLKFANQE